MKDRKRWFVRPWPACPLALCLAAATTMNCGERVTEPVIQPIVYETSFTPAMDRPLGVATGREGRIYIADGNNNRIVVLNSEGTFLEAWGPPGSATVISLSVPMGIATDADGFVYFTDSGNNRVVKFTWDGNFVDEVGTFGTGLGQFDEPNPIAVGPGRVLYVGETGTAASHRIQKLTLDLVPIRACGSFGSQNGQFNDPFGIATDKDGNVYVADHDNSRIQVFTPDCVFLRSWGSRGVGPGQFDNPRGLVIDSESRIFVTDGLEDQTTNSRVQIFTLEGRFLGSFGGPSFGVTGDTRGRFNTPHGMTILGDQLFVVDRLNHRVQRFRIVPHALTR